MLVEIRVEIVEYELKESKKKGIKLIEKIKIASN